MKTLYIDCGMGCAGDMLTGALLELHPDPEAFISKMNAVFAGKAVISAKPDRKCGIGGTHITVLINGDEEGKPIAHRHEHTSISEILQFIENTPLPGSVRENASAVYRLIADAESAVHGGAVENIHFHEVGSIDALADVLNVCELMYELAPESVSASPVNVGGGTVRCAHGVIPVPAPATELLLRGVPCYGGDIKSELCTPTGAALLRHFAADFGSMPTMRIERCGCGTGTKSFETANVLRVMLGICEDMHETVCELSCNIDDMTAEDLGFAMERLFSAGALDVFFTSAGMKKCRPSVVLTCLCRENMRGDMLRCIFKHTSTLGVRERECRRYSLSRSFRTAETPLGDVRIKVSDGFGVHREKPEYDDLARISRETGLSISEIRSIVEKS